MTLEEELNEALKLNGESWQDVESHTLTTKQTYSDASRGLPAFTLWTAKNVYFPAVYDGDYWVCAISRNPNGVPKQPVGGE